LSYTAKKGILNWHTLSVEGTKMLATSLAEITQLSTAERIQLVEDIWDTIAAQPERVGLSEAQTQELDRRLSAYQQNPQDGATWQEVQQRVRGQK
jgi:putative addiction module component (TIGR02574 family)